MYEIAEITLADEDIYWRVKEIGLQNATADEQATALSVKYVWRARDLEYELEKLGISHDDLTQDQFDWILGLWDSNDVDELAEIAWNATSNLPA